VANAAGTVRTEAAGLSGSRAAVLGQILLAALLGAFIVFGVGFAHIDALHNAAHDVRHSNGFPCH
jgi:cobalt transporter subunit CbtB